MYNWQQKNWPQFEYKETDFTEIALAFVAMAGQSLGYWQTLSGTEQAESVIALLVNEAIKTSSIEGEFISRIDLISSIRKNLGYPTPSDFIRDKRSEGIAALLVKARENFAADLTEAVLFDWHTLLMAGHRGIQVGQYRSHTEPMQVISGTVGHEQVHFEAPPSTRVSAEMDAFFSWFNRTKPGGLSPIPNLLIRAAIAHLYFETIHPFEDGNGRIGRVIAEKALAQGVNRPMLMSLSTRIEADKRRYYEALKKAQRNSDVTDWINYFSETVLQAQQEFITAVDFSVKKAKFFDRYNNLLNESQRKVLGRMLAVGEATFQGGMNARKYQSISGVSKATATRHLQDLVEKNILQQQKGGRSTNYQINLDS